MTRRKIALAGIGKIARDQHVPSLAASPDWALVATVSRSGRIDGLPGYASIAEMRRAHPEVDTISLCMPPQPRFPYAREAIEAGLHVMLEKPPGQTLAEVETLRLLAAARGVTLYATWHSRMAREVAAAKAWLSGRRVTKAHVTWREDVRKWHPGQDWVFDPGGMGVFDPGINALSILTEILPAPVHVTAATLDYPANRDTPIAARLIFSGGVSADFDWRQEGPQTWDIEIETDAGPLALRHGGNQLWLNGVEAGGSAGIEGEYPALYARMAALVAAGESEVDLAPMIHVADALTLGKRVTVAAFDW